MLRAESIQETLKTCIDAGLMHTSDSQADDPTKDFNYNTSMSDTYLERHASCLKVEACRALIKRLLYLYMIA